MRLDMIDQIPSFVVLSASVLEGSLIDNPASLSLVRFVPVFMYVLIIQQSFFALLRVCVFSLDITLKKVGEHYGMIY